MHDNTNFQFPLRLYSHSDGDANRRELQVKTYPHDALALACLSHACGLVFVDLCRLGKKYLCKTRRSLEEMKMFVEVDVAEQDDYAVRAMLLVWARVMFLMSLISVARDDPISSFGLLVEQLHHTRLLPHSQLQARPKPRSLIFFPLHRHHPSCTTRRASFVPLCQVLNLAVARFISSVWARLARTHLGERVVREEF